MKKLKKILSIFALTILSISCSKEDETPPSLLGKWQFEKQANYANNVLQPESEHDFNSAICKSYYEFKENNQMFFGQISGNPCTLNILEGKYVFDGKSISGIIQPLFPGSILRITTLTKTDLIFDIITPSIGPTEMLMARFFLKRI